MTSGPCTANGLVALTARLLFALLLVAPPVGGEVDFAALRVHASQERVTETLARFASYQSRVVGYPGAEAAARYIEDTFRDIGLDGITVHEYDVSIPMERAPGALMLAATGETVPLHGLWPNLVRTSTLPTGGCWLRP